ncbi:hypothetical protein KAR91_26160 [Candidatus Pacearchaeota archaeon]|nr:hypothetical protein [Candidatus Pacearchaeota archaeon]
MSNLIFDNAFLQTVGIEKGYVNDPDDPGGETKWGISARSYPDEDIPNLTKERAKFIYKRDYWDKLNLDGVKMAVIAEEIFDTSVNMGRGSASRIAQKAVNFIAGRSVLVIDGKIGPVTLDYINRWIGEDGEAFYKALNGFQFMRYYEIIQGRPKSAKFAKGWMKRIFERSE